MRFLLVVIAHHSQPHPSCIKEGHILLERMHKKANLTNLTIMNATSLEKCGAVCYSQAPCPSSGGGKHYDGECPTCHGDRTVVVVTSCGNCDATGYLKDGSKCPSCDEGSITTTEPCTDCLGSEQDSMGEPSELILYSYARYGHGKG
jgi:hypothetical protein